MPKSPDIKFERDSDAPYSNRRVEFKSTVAVADSQNGITEWPLSDHFRKKEIDVDVLRKMKTKFGYSTTADTREFKLSNLLKFTADYVEKLIDAEDDTVITGLIGSIENNLNLIFDNREPINNYKKFYKHIFELKNLIKGILNGEQPLPAGKLEVLTSVLNNVLAKITVWLDNQPPWSNLWFAVDNGEVDMVTELCASWSNDADVLNFQNPDDDGRTPLHIALHDTNLMNILLRTPGIDVNQGDDYGKTPLFKAALDGYIDAAALLVNIQGIELNKAPIGGNYLGISPLAIALERADKESDCGEVATILQRAGTESLPLPSVSSGVSSGGHSKKRKNKTKRKHLIKKFRTTKSKKNKRSYKKTMHNKGKERP